MAFLPRGTSVTPLRSRPFRAPCAPSSAAWRANVPVTLTFPERAMRGRRCVRSPMSTACATASSSA
eukprot:1927256-Prymnesium_polylepis.1